MLKSIGVTIGVLVFVALIQTSIATSAQAQTAGKIPVTTIVTVLGPKFTVPPAVTKQDVVVFSGKTRLDVIDWVPAQGQKGGLQLAIVIDNSANLFGAGSALHEVADFITRLPVNTAIGVFYAINGSVQVGSPFSADRDAVARTLRMPLGPGAGNSPSVYLSLSELIKHRWPLREGRREVLLISSGVDRLNGGPESPYVAGAIEDAQRAGIEVHAIYTAGANFDESVRGQFAQGNLMQLAQFSGGFNLFEGVSTPMTFSPYLKMLDMALRHQYRLTFATDPSNNAKGDLRPITIRTELHHVELRYPKLVMVPAS